MQLTNKHNLPDAVVRALGFDNYSKGDADYSVTEIIDAPRIRALQWLHREKIERDVTDNFFSLLGRAVHQILEWGAERTPGATAEERLFLTTNVDGVDVTVSGSMDLQEAAGKGVDISDYKCTSVMSFQSEKSSWDEQLNLYAHLVRETKGKKVRSLRIVAFLRDWTKSKAKRDPNYPQSPIAIQKIALWHPDDAASFLQERLRLHMNAGEAVMCGDEPEMCSAEERWEDDPTFAVLKKGGKRALRVYETEIEANEHLAQAPDDLVIEKRGSEPRRCAANWCQVAQFCTYGKQFHEGDNEL